MPKLPPHLTGMIFNLFNHNPLRVLRLLHSSRKRLDLLSPPPSGLSLVSPLVRPLLPSSHLSAERQRELALRGSPRTRHKKRKTQLQMH